MRRAADIADEAMLSEIALRVLYQRKTFREVTGMNEEHYPDSDPNPPGLGRHHGLGAKEKRRKNKKKGPKSPGHPAREIDYANQPDERSSDASGFLSISCWRYQCRGNASGGLVPAMLRDPRKFTAMQRVVLAVDASGARRSIRLNCSLAASTPSVPAGIG